jgi:hypothetical protein
VGKLFFYDFSTENFEFLSQIRTSIDVLHFDLNANDKITVFPADFEFSETLKQSVKKVIIQEQRFDRWIKHSSEMTIQSMRKFLPNLKMLHYISLDHRMHKENLNLWKQTDVSIHISSSKPNFTNLLETRGATALHLNAQTAFKSDKLVIEFKDYYLLHALKDYLILNVSRLEVENIWPKNWDAEIEHILTNNPPVFQGQIWIALEYTKIDFLSVDTSQFKFTEGFDLTKIKKIKLKIDMNSKFLKSCTEMVVWLQEIMKRQKLVLECDFEIPMFRSRNLLQNGQSHTIWKKHIGWLKILLKLDIYALTLSFSNIHLVYNSEKLAFLLKNFPAYEEMGAYISKEEYENTTIIKFYKSDLFKIDPEIIQKLVQGE